MPRFRFKRCRECENQFHPRVYGVQGHVGLQVRRVAGSGKALAGDSGWEAVLLRTGGRVVKIGVLVLGKTTREAVARSALAAGKVIDG